MSQIDEEKAWSEAPAPKMDELIALMTTSLSRSDLPEDLQKSIKAVLDTRTNERWATAEAENAKAKEEAAKSLAKPAPRKSAAIRIEVGFWNISHSHVYPRLQSSSKHACTNFFSFFHSLIQMTSELRW